MVVIRLGGANGACQAFNTSTDSPPKRAGSTRMVCQASGWCESFAAAHAGLGITVRTFEHGQNGQIIVRAKKVRSAKRTVQIANFFPLTGADCAAGVTLPVSS